MERFQRLLATFLSVLLAAAPIPGWAQLDSESGNSAKSHTVSRLVYQSKQLRGDQRILHALNRFTFGPRPGDLDAVREMGLDKWFEEQLHPVLIDQTELETRLGQFPAIQSNSEELLARFPSNAVVRQAMDGKAPIPENPALHAIYENQIARIEFNRQQQEQKKASEAKGREQAQAPIATTLNAIASMAGENAMSAGTATMASGPAQSGDMAPGAMSAPAAPAPLAQPIPTQPAFDESLIPKILALPPQKRAVRLGHMQPAEFESFRKALKPPQRAALVADLGPGLREEVEALDNPRRVVVSELVSRRLARDTYSNAQLLEVMTDFWLNHFNVYLQKNEETPYYLANYEQDVIRPRALGKFEDLLEATAHSPAMLLYLDNANSMGPDSPAAERAKVAAARRPSGQQKLREGLNENYARELMELHTLGVNGGYTQADVTQVARVFTGWTVDRPQRGGGFRFEENRHEPGTKKVLGKKIKEHGEYEGRQVLHMLASSPATAHFLSRELAERFVGDQPPQALVDRLAKSYKSSDGDISAVLRTLFRSPEFWADSVYRTKVKTPLEFVVSALRAGDFDTTNYQPLENALNGMGMQVYGSVPPTGYSWQSAAWVSTGALVNRMNFALSLAANRFPGVKALWAPQTNAAETPKRAHATLVSNPVADPNDLGSSPEAQEQHLESMLVAGGVSASTRTAVLDQFQAREGRNLPSRNTTPAVAAAALEKQDQLLAGLLLGSPEFQRR